MMHCLTNLPLVARTASFHMLVSANGEVNQHVVLLAQGDQSRYVLILIDIQDIYKS